MAQNLSNLPIGAKVKFGKHSINGETAQDIIWVVVAKNHTGYPTNSVTLLTECIIDLRATDGAEPSNADNNRKTSGNSDYGVSNIDQWLNSAAGGAWYVGKHTYDAPPNNTNTQRGTGYDNRPGFLHNFTSNEINSILDTTIKTSKYNYTTEDITRKVYLPSSGEVGVSIGDIKDGTIWGYFSNDASRRATVTLQCFNNTLSSRKPSEIGSYWKYWLRSAVVSTTHSVYYINDSGSVNNSPANSGDNGIRPALNLPSSLFVSDTTDSDGCYTPLWNSAPPVPTTLNVPTIYGGKSATISWNSVIDPDGNPVTYQLERSINGGEFITIYSGTNPLYTTPIAYGSTSVQFRLKAIDSLGASSGYITSTNRTVVNNTAPTISDSDRSLGTKREPFTQTYTISDTESSTVTVTESIDKVKVRSYVAVRGVTNTFSVEGKTWLKLDNGSHTMTITATDGLDSSTREYTFFKNVRELTIVTNVMPASVMPTRIKVVVDKNIPPEATFVVSVCNNGFDSEPTWENATNMVNAGWVHGFLNTTKTASQWGVRIKVEVKRAGGDGACYVSSIGGNFE
jgi:hypothetical protein